ncbi:ABC-2 type transport system permease protein [Stackebrandtia endophytica]|uniref:ABC-2 type transport system permease protein n=1 Tax=Stackebrandtia endophytica TaxID=1496996 RepID=A0A543AQG6_9ACTN|nr:ABC-2 type transport system permease protein [Stackebrandtia endophytica]
MLLTLLRYVMDSSPATFDYIGLTMLGVFPFISMFLVTSVAMLRERTSGTLERMLTTPVHKLDLIVGYGLAFSIAAALQSAVATGVAYWLLDLTTRGAAWLVILIAIANAVLGMALGLFVSAFANSEFQAVQFMPAVVLPQILLCGLIWPRDEMVGWLQGIARVLPLTYAVEALTEVGAHADPTAVLWRDLGIVAGCAVAALMLGALTLRRRTG